MRFNWSRPEFGLKDLANSSPVGNNNQTNIKPTGNSSRGNSSTPSVQTTSAPTPTPSVDLNGFNFGTNNAWPTIDLSALQKASSAPAQTGDLMGFSSNPAPSTPAASAPAPKPSAPASAPEVTTQVQPEQATFQPAQTQAPSISLEALSAGGPPAAAPASSAPATGGTRVGTSGGAPAAQSQQVEYGNPKTESYTGLWASAGDYDDMTQLSDQQLNDILEFGANAATADQRREIRLAAEAEQAARRGTYTQPTGNGMAPGGGQAGVEQIAPPTSTAPDQPLQTGAVSASDPNFQYDPMNPYDGYGFSNAQIQQFQEWEDPARTPMPSAGTPMSGTGSIRLGHTGIPLETQRQMYENGYYSGITPQGYYRLYGTHMPAGYQPVPYNPDYVASITSSIEGPDFGGTWGGPDNIPEGTNTYTPPGGTTPTYDYTGGGNPNGTNNGSNPGGTNPGNPNPGGTNTGGNPPGGTNPGGTNPGGANPGGTNPGGTGPGDRWSGPGTTDPGAGLNPGGTNPGVPQGNPNNGTAPNVYQLLDQDFDQYTTGDPALDQLGAAVADNIMSGDLRWMDLTPNQRDQALAGIDAMVAGDPNFWVNWSESSTGDPQLLNFWKQKYIEQYGDPTQGNRGAADNTRNEDGSVQGQFEGDTDRAYQAISSDAAALGSTAVEDSQAFTSGGANAAEMTDMDVEDAVAGQAAENNRTVQDEELSSVQLNDILRQDSPLMMLARQDGVNAANRMGLRNSSLAAGAQMAEMTRQATPLAQQQAEAYRQAAAQNQTLESQRRDAQANRDQSNSQFNASQQNAATSQEFATEAERRSFNAAQDQQNQQFNAGQNQQNSQFNAQQQNVANIRDQELEAARRDANAARQTSTAVTNAGMANDMMNADRQRELQYNLQQLAGDQDYAKQELAAQTAIDVANVEGTYKRLISENDTAARLYDSYYDVVADVLGNAEYGEAEATRRLGDALRQLEAGMELILGFENYNANQGTGDRPNSPGQIDFTTMPPIGTPEYFEWLEQNFGGSYNLNIP